MPRGLAINSKRIQPVNLGEGLSRHDKFHAHTATREHVRATATEYRRATFAKSFFCAFVIFAEAHRRKAIHQSEKISASFIIVTTEPGARDEHARHIGIMTPTEIVPPRRCAPYASTGMKICRLNAR
jgi:hypothetical protein